MRNITIAALLILVGICLPALAQQEKPTFAEIAQATQKLAQLQDSFEGAMPKGISVTVKESLRRGTPGKDLVVGYSIWIHGLPADTDLRQLQWPVDKAKPLAGFSGMTLNADEQLICAGRKPEECHQGTHLDAPMLFAIKNPLAGEPFRMIFVAGDLRIPVSVEPNPVEGEDGGCKLSVVRLSAKFEVARIEGSGFPPNSDVHVIGTGDEDATEVTVKDQAASVAKEPGVTVHANARGVLQAMTTLNETALKPSGEKTVSVTGDGCKPKVHYVWGAY